MSSRPLIAVLTRWTEVYEVDRFAHAAAEAGADFVAVPPETWHLGQLPTVLLDRMGAEASSAERAVAEAFAAEGIAVLNAPAASALAADKLVSASALRHAGVAVPDGFAADSHWLIARGAALLGWPLVVKPVRAARGRGVRLIETPAELAAAVEDAREPLVVQRRVFGDEFRAIVVAGRVIAFGRRVPAPGSLAANAHAGGIVEAAEPNAEQVEAAVSAAHVLGLAIAGVDLIGPREAPAVLEVNSAPGFRAMEAATGVDVAGAIVAYALEVAGGA